MTDISFNQPVLLFFFPRRKHEVARQKDLCFLGLLYFSCFGVFFNPPFGFLDRFYVTAGCLSTRGRNFQFGWNTWIIQKKTKRKQ